MGVTGQFQMGNMIACWRFVRTAQNLKTQMILQVHDELLFDLHNNEQEMVVSLVIEKMQTALPMSVPIEVEIGIGRNWLEAH